MPISSSPLFSVGTPSIVDQIFSKVVGSFTSRASRMFRASVRCFASQFDVTVSDVNRGDPREDTIESRRVLYDWRDID